MASKDSQADWEQTKERIREAADIVQIVGEHVQLRRAGGHFTGLCPFHGEKTPSFSVNPQRQSYKCFGCGESGDVFSFLMKYQNLSFPEVMKALAGRYQISLPEPKLSEAEEAQRQQRGLLHAVNQAAAQLYHEVLLKAPQAEAARQYLIRRGVPQEFLVRYQLGYAPNDWDFAASRLTKTFPAEAVAQAGLIAAKKNGWYDRFRDRIMFPILDAGGKTAAFGGRILGDGQPKYMNSPESLVFSKGRVLFGLHQHRDAIRQSRRAVLVEGNFDLLLLDVHGISNTVAPLGTALTKEHVRTLRGCCNEAVLLFDGDAAGQKAAKRAVPLFLAERMEAKAALLPSGHDPDSFVREQGAAALQELISKAQPLAEFIFDALVEEHGVTLTGKSRIMAELAELVREAPDRGQQELMAAHFSSKLGVSPQHFLPGGLPQRQEEPEQLPPFAPPPEFFPEAEDSGHVEITAAPAPVHLPNDQRQLFNFLVQYPEHFDKLMVDGLLMEHVHTCAQPLRDLTQALQRLAAAGPILPEQLLAHLPDGSQARQMVTELILRGAAQDTPDEDEEQGASAYAVIRAWLRDQKKKRDNKKIFQQIDQTEDTETVQNLQRQIQPDIKKQPFVN
ncbi:DNA primase [Candidatus Electronema sp. JM]|uniref:DNA primase n=1 Tax=Candidatus Electronema sp. JM TaxID=3401571 RepID=UPI003AA9258C